MIWPFFLGAGVAHLLGLPWNSRCFLGGALTATSVSISARTLMDAGKMSSPEASVILGAAVIDDVMGLFVLAFLAAACNCHKHRSLELRPMLSNGSQNIPIGGTSSSVMQMTLIAVCVAVYFFVAYGAAKTLARPAHPHIAQARRQ